MGYSNKTYICPFFKWDEKMKVHCEGGRVDFPDQSARGDFLDRYCAGQDWGSCAIARLMLQYYERRDGGHAADGV